LLSVCSILSLLILKVQELSKLDVEEHLEFRRKRLVRFGQVRVRTIEVVDLDDQILVFRLVFLLEPTRFALQLRLQLHDGALHVFSAASAVPPE